MNAIEQQQELEISRLEAENAELRATAEASREYWKHVNYRNSSQAAIAWRKLAKLLCEWVGK